MISLVEVRNFRSLRALQRPLGNFHVLVGPNASGKTTFLDVFRFLGDIIEKGIDKAIAERTPNFLDLTFGNTGGPIEFAVEAIIPDAIRQQLESSSINRVRYEIRLGLWGSTNENVIQEERVILHDYSTVGHYSKRSNAKFPLPPTDTDISTSLKAGFYSRTYKVPVLREDQLKTIYQSELLRSYEYETPKAHNSLFLSGNPKQSALTFLPYQAQDMPATIWLRDMLVTGTQPFILDSLNIRRPSPPGLSVHFRTDGSNLPWVIEELRKTPGRFQKWVAHVRTALPDVEDIDTVERPEDRHRYLRVRYNSGLVVPSWLVSDGTLRLLALTLPAYLPDFSGLYLIEEPENGIHPAAMETVYQSLSAIYGAQMLLATHSPVILGMVEPQQVLCFAKTSDGVTDIVRGDEHPLLRDWQGDINLSQLYASGILG